MIIRHFLLWARTAPDDQRMEAVGALARAYLYSSELKPSERLEAELALLAMADDPCPGVRLAMAEVLCRSADSPRSVITALLQDTNEVAGLFLAHSPLLTDAELIDLAAISEPEGQAAIARRTIVSPALAGALCEVGGPESVLALLRNPGATIASISIARTAERLGHHVEIREELLRRTDLPIEVRLTLATALARTLYDYADQKGQQAERLEQTAREARERAVVSIAVGADPQLVQRMVAHLRKTGELTPALILRATLSHGLTFAEMAFAELTSLPVSRIAPILQQGGAPLLRDEARALARSVAEEAGILDLTADELADDQERLAA
jgi:uncharacterized protein (DUF2336 family)